MPKNARKRRQLIAYRNRKAAKRRAEMKRRNAGSMTKRKRKSPIYVYGIAPNGSPGLLGSMLMINDFLHPFKTRR